MGAMRSLTRRIIPAAVEIARLSANKRWEVYLHSAAKKRVKLMVESRELKPRPR